jgi:hypothetical protein
MISDRHSGITGHGAVFDQSRIALDRYAVRLSDRRAALRGSDVAGSGRARRFRAARQLKQGGRERICSACHANLTLGETHDPECEFAQEDDPWADELGGGGEDEEDEEEAW